ncbi:MAG: DUF1566 domain-containing protein, partial [Campylobacterota bacterium]|nr:DUF1566 domain-containing protein [Campylobacterota bacterium]
YNLTAIATNTAGNSTSITVDISINDLPDIVPTIENFTASIDENATIGTLIGNITISDSGDRNITSFTLSETSNFDINSSGYIVTNTTFDYETTNEYNLTVYATSDSGNSLDKNVTITINDIPEVASIADLIINIDENIESGITIGTLNITQGDSIITSIDLNNSNNGIVSNEFQSDIDGIITLKDNILLDYETKSVYTLDVRALNSAGYSEIANLTININDVNSSIPILYDFETTLYSGFSEGYVVGQVNIEQGDDAITSVTIVSGTHGDNFNISLDGTITLSDTVDFSDTNIANYTFAIKATTSSGDSNTVTVTINMIYAENLYILSAVYDTNQTAIVDDDKLYIYFNQTVKPESFSASIADDLEIIGEGSIGTGSITINNDSTYHQLIISNDSSTGGIAPKFGIDTIKISENTLTDISDTFPTNYIETVIEKYKPISKTGQTSSYDENGTNDMSIKDDFYYSNLSLDINMTRDDVNEIVYDNNLNVMWQDTNITTASNSWQDAMDYCANLSLGGFTDWYLPSVQELNNIFDKSKFKPAMNSVFINTDYYGFWVRDEVSSDTSSAWILLVESGNLFPISKSYNAIYPKCIHEN